MPVAISPFLMLWSALLLSGNEAGPRAGLEAVPTPHPISSIALACHPVPLIEAVLPETGWAWRISEADTTEEESDDGDDLGPGPGDLSRGRLLRDRSESSPIRPDCGSFRSPFRSPILRC
jgi:hypothetical protein